MDSVNDVAAKAAQVSEAGQKHLYPPPADLAAAAHVKSLDEYKAMYRQSIDDPETFFGNMARQFHWEKPFDSVGPVYNFDLSKGPIKIDWFQGGKTNICYNALDRHVAAGRPQPPRERSRVEPFKADNAVLGEVTAGVQRCPTR